MKATWFVDPPYQNMGKLYKENKIDYQELGTYCRERLGQVMVCENEGADWLPFEKLTEIVIKFPDKTFLKFLYNGNKRYVFITSGNGWAKEYGKYFY